jgi:hypothetical protein
MRINQNHLSPLSAKISGFRIDPATNYLLLIEPKSTTRRNTRNRATPIEFTNTKIMLQSRNIKPLLQIACFVAVIAFFAVEQSSYQGVGIGSSRRYLKTSDSSKSETKESSSSTSTSKSKMKTAVDPPVDKDEDENENENTHGGVDEVAEDADKDEGNDFNEADVDGEDETEDSEEDETEDSEESEEDETEELEEDETEDSEEDETEELEEDETVESEGDETKDSEEDEGAEMEDSNDADEEAVNNDKPGVETKAKEGSFREKVAQDEMENEEEIIEEFLEVNDDTDDLGHLDPYTPMDDEPIEEEDEELVEEVEEELQHEEKVARTAGGFGFLLAIAGMIFTAHQMSENPDGFYAR